MKWDFLDNSIFLNPRLPIHSSEGLTALAKKASEQLKLRNHYWFSTSGTTASPQFSPKLVALSQDAIFEAAKSVNQHLDTHASDRWLQSIPEFHVGGMGILARAHLAKCVVIPYQSRWDTENFVNIIKNEKITLASLVPTQVFDLVSRTQRAPSFLKAIIVGGDPLDPKIYEQARSLGWPLLPSYGMTETASQVATADLMSLQQNQFPQVRPLPHVRLQSNSNGHIQIQSRSLLTCYAQIQNGQHHIWDPKIDNWFTTDDIGQIHNDGSIQIHGRSIDFIKVGGESVNIAPLRTLFNELVHTIFPSKSSHAVLNAVQDPRLGYCIAAFVEKDILSENELRYLSNEFSKKVLPFERIKKVIFISKIPRTELGKVIWSQL